MNRCLLFIHLIIIFCSCSKLPEPVRIALKAAGENRHELEKYSRNLADADIIFHFPGVYFCSQASGYDYSFTCYGKNSVLCRYGITDNRRQHITVQFHE
jgi:hypothetical protein